jgi:hypothetical protein
MAMLGAEEVGPVTTTDAALGLPISTVFVDLPKNVNVNGSASEGSMIVMVTVGVMIMSVLDPVELS